MVHDIAGAITAALAFYPAIATLASMATSYCCIIKEEEEVAAEQGSTQVLALALRRNLRPCYSLMRLLEQWFQGLPLIKPLAPLRNDCQASYLHRILRRPARRLHLHCAQVLHHMGYCFAAVADSQGS